MGGLHFCFWCNINFNARFSDKQVQPLSVQERKKELSSVITAMSRPRPNLCYWPILAYNLYAFETRSYCFEIQFFKRFFRLHLTRFASFAYMKILRRICLFESSRIGYTASDRKLALQMKCAKSWQVSSFPQVCQENIPSRRIS